MPIDKYLDKLDDVLEDSLTLPLTGGKRMIDIDKVRDLVDDIRMHLPQEIKDAKAIVGDREQIIKDAKLEAEEDENETHGEFELLSPDEFGENEDEYPVISLKYYADQALADENDHLVRNSESLIGTDALNHFGDFEDDAVYVRNNRLKCEYEILLDQRKYADVLKKKPYITED